MRRPSLKQWLSSFVTLLLYSLTGTVIFMALEPEWDAFTAMYFTFTIISTVGYGCVTPSTYDSRVFAMIYTVLSVPLFAAALSHVWEPLTVLPYKYTQRRLAKLPFFNKENDDPLSPVSAFKFYARGLGPIFVYGHLFACFIMSLLAFAVGQIDNMYTNSLATAGQTKFYYFDALYFTVITSSTVGFGDICPATNGARAFTAAMACYGIGIVSLFVKVFAQLRDEREKTLEYARRLNTEAQGHSLIEQLDVSGDGLLDRCEFVLGMLQALDLVKSEDVGRLLADFDRIDTDKSGTLSREDIKLVLDERAKAVKTMGKSGGALTRAMSSFRLKQVMPSVSTDSATTSGTGNSNRATTPAKDSAA